MSNNVPEGLLATNQPDLFFEDDEIGGEGHDLHGGRQVQGGVNRAGRYPDQVMAAVDLGVAQTGLFTTEKHGHPALVTLFPDQRRALPRTELRARDAAATGAGANDQAAIIKEVVQVLADLCARQYVIRARGARRGLGMRKVQWLQQPQVSQAHGFHGTGSGPDIPGMTGVQQCHTDIRQHGSVVSRK